MSRIGPVVALVLLPAVAGADRIHLENGKSFDDVIVLERTADRIHFRLASGEMSLPSSWVTGVERERGALEQYLERKEAIAADPEATAETWLRLARWARARDVEHGFREALLMAGELEPGLEGLAPLMASIDYHYRAEEGAWFQGRPAAASPSRARASTGPERKGDGTSDPRPFETSAEQDVAQGLTRALERLAEAELERTRARSADPEPPRRRTATFGTMVYPIVAVPAGFTTTGWVFPGVPLRGPDSDPNDPVIRKPLNPQARALLARPPGSLLPLSAYQY